MGKKDKVKYRMELAEYDLDTAKVMLNSERFLYVGFMCHQAVEKILSEIFKKTGEIYLWIKQKLLK
jgi:HEPN domain-containing protein